MGDTRCWFLTKEQKGKDQHAPMRTTCLLFFLTYSINHKANKRALRNKPRRNFVVYPLFMFCIPNTYIAKRIAVSLFIGQG